MTHLLVAVEDHRLGHGVQAETQQGQDQPAGQGALAVECREDDRSLTTFLRDVLEDEPTRAAVTAERAVLARLEAGCTAPVGALARADADGVLALTAFVALGDVPRRHAETGSDPVALGHEVAEHLLSRPDPVGTRSDDAAAPGSLSTGA